MTTYPTYLNGYTISQLKNITVKWYNENKTVSECLAQAEWNNGLGKLYGFSCSIWITKDGKLHTNKPKRNA